MRSQYLFVLGFVAAIATVSLLYSRTRTGVPSEVQALYKSWKAKHQLTFHPQEDERRLKNFYSNYKFIENHNSNPKRTYTVGLNKFAALNFEEFISKMIFCRYFLFFSRYLHRCPNSKDHKQKYHRRALQREGSTSISQLD